MDYYNSLKALHIIFVLTWFVGLFNIVRLFVYQIEANDKPSPEKEILQAQCKIMSYRLQYIITCQIAILASIFAFWMLFFTDLGQAWLKMPWMHVKLGFVVLLLIYHFICQRIMKQLKLGSCKLNSFKLRLLNEVATILLVAIVFTVILKNAVDWIYGLIGLIIFAVVIMAAVKWYKHYRTKHDS